ncbi:FAD-binding protein [Glarea lozoyensis ATCC 20868]|uniref:FAD-binding protein n=1 Tax=Glarea lozoyensis (strain ATCC 20868 / MF5171) TaxID=1116229 RepID=S3DNZ9_GLAL2|nr:FAD-binding protein [Glarea lozoyensis ATCC 20868]EPE33791.1 FAD-binding protein [Glarea lozoyensis ATCC 20868]
MFSLSLIARCCVAVLAFASSCHAVPSDPSFAFAPLSIRQGQAVDAAIASLRAVIPTRILAVRGTALYDERNDSYLAAQVSEVKPVLIFLPTSKEQVALFIKIIKPFAVVGIVRFAIRGAGQMPLPTAANIQDGITLDLVNLKGISLDTCSVTVAAGEIWGNVYSKLEGTGYGVGGSRSGLGGIGGLATQGGLSFFSSREGLIADNVLNYEIVLASGEIVNANAKQNSDLWVSLKGGNNNFGVITSFTLRTFKQSPFWGGSIYYFSDSFPGQIDALVGEIKKPNPSPETQLMISIGYSSQLGGILCQNQLYYTQNVTSNPPVLKPFTDISPQIDSLNSMRPLTLKSAASEQAADARNQLRTLYMNTMIKADAATLKAASTYYTTAISTITSVTDLLGSLTLQPYPLSLLNQQAPNGGNVLGLDPSSGPLVSILLLTYWSNPADDALVYTTMKSVLDKINADATARKTLVPFKFMNYATKSDDVISSYGATNKAKLQKASKKYDPQGLFQTGVPGGFKLFK